MKLVFLLFLLAAAASVSSSNDFNVSVASTDPVVAPEPLAAGNVHCPDVNEEVPELVVLYGEWGAWHEEFGALLPEMGNMPASREKLDINLEMIVQVGMYRLAENLILESCNLSIKSLPEVVNECKMTIAVVARMIPKMRAKITILATSGYRLSFEPFLPGVVVLGLCAVVVMCRYTRAFEQM